MPLRLLTPAETQAPTVGERRRGSTGRQGVGVGGRCGQAKPAEAGTAAATAVAAAAAAGVRAAGAAYGGRSAHGGCAAAAQPSSPNRGPRRPAHPTAFSVSVWSRCRTWCRRYEWCRFQVEV